MIKFICDVLGYTMVNGANYNFDSQIYAIAAMLIVTSYILAVWFLTRFFQGLWRMGK